MTSLAHGLKGSATACERLQCGLFGFPLAQTYLKLQKQYFWSVTLENINYWGWGHSHNVTCLTKTNMLPQKWQIRRPIRLESIVCVSAICELVTGYQWFEVYDTIAVCAP